MQSASDCIDTKEYTPSRCIECIRGALHLEEYYTVCFNDRDAGKVQLIRQGLYCRVICRCQVPGDRVFRLYSVGSDCRENLGVVVPEGDGFVLDRKIPAKRLGEGNIRFLLSDTDVQPDNVSGGTFVPICPEEPFLYIERLKTAFLQSENGKIGIRITEHPEAV